MTEHPRRPLLRISEQLIDAADQLLVVQGSDDLERPAHRDEARRLERHVVDATVLDVDRPGVLASP